MDVYSAQELALELMRKHNLISYGWVFELDNAKTRLGRCNHMRKLITFSKNYLRLIEKEEILNTILHEIAHALVGHSHGHDHIWQRTAIEIGCNGSRVYKGGKKVIGKYAATCKKCGAVHYKHRMSNKTARTSCGICGNGMFDPENVLIYHETI